MRARLEIDERQFLRFTRNEIRAEGSTGVRRSYREDKKQPVMVRLGKDDRAWVRKQAETLQKLTGTFSESAVIRLAIQRLREAVSGGVISWELEESSDLGYSVFNRAGRGRNH